MYVYVQMGVWRFDLYCIFRNVIEILLYCLKYFRRFFFKLFFNYFK